MGNRSPLSPCKYPVVSTLPVEQDVVELESPGQWERMKMNILSLVSIPQDILWLNASSLDDSLYCSKDIAGLNNGSM